MNSIKAISFAASLAITAAMTVGFAAPVGAAAPAAATSCAAADAGVSGAAPRNPVRKRTMFGFARALSGTVPAVSGQVAGEALANRPVAPSNSLGCRAA